ncbi:hypothetical protein Hanom_Chr06g00549641 [Helianthus anomalus]
MVFSLPFDPFSLNDQNPPPKVVKKALWGPSFYLTGQTNRKGWFFHCKKSN